MSPPAQENSGKSRKWGCHALQIPAGYKLTPIQRMRLPILLSLALVLAEPLWAEAPSIAGTLPEDLVPQLKPLLKASVERSPNTISAAIAVAEQEASKLGARAILLPSLNLNSSYQSTRETESGSHILLSDGRLSLKVLKVKGDDVLCEVVDGGWLGTARHLPSP